MAKWKYLLLLLYILIQQNANSQEICKDEDNNDITTCDRCLWEKDCKWCMEPLVPDDVDGNFIQYITHSDVPNKPACSFNVFKSAIYRVFHIRITFINGLKMPEKQYVGKKIRQ